jgi:hypothetical protein
VLPHRHVVAAAAAATTPACPDIAAAAVAVIQHKAAAAAADVQLHRLECSHLPECSPSTTDHEVGVSKINLLQDNYVKSSMLHEMLHKEVQGCQGAFCERLPDMGAIHMGATANQYYCYCWLRSCE